MNSEHKERMGNILQYFMNWNYKYEWKHPNGEWYPCHIYEDTSGNMRKLEENEVRIYTRNGYIMVLDKKEVREMSQERYQKQTEENREFLGSLRPDYGY